MQYTILLLLFVFLNQACTSESTSSTSTTTTTDSSHQVVPNNTPQPKTQHSAYKMLNDHTYSGKVGEHQEKAFLQLIGPQQASFNQAEAGRGKRTDTLYAVHYLPFKDQELYLYQTVLDHARGGTQQWCLSILKNGETLIDEHIISSSPYTKLEFQASKAPTLQFSATKSNGEKKVLTIPYDGKKIP